MAITTRTTSRAFVADGIQRPRRLDPTKAPLTYAVSAALEILRAVERIQNPMIVVEYAPDTSPELVAARAHCDAVIAATPAPACHVETLHSPIVGDIDVVVHDVAPSPTYDVRPGTTEGEG